MLQYHKMAQSDNTRTIGSVETVFDIVEVIQREEGATASDVADEVDKSLSTVYDYLSTLHKRDYVRHEDGTYYVGLEFLNHGMHARNRYETAEIAEPILDTLAEETGEVVWYYVEENGRSAVIVRRTGEEAVQTVGRMGWRSPLHQTAAGKTILAHLPGERVDEIIDEHGLEPLTENTLSDREDLAEELAEIRDRGYSLNDGETVDGLRAVAAPVITDDEVRGAVSVSGPSHRIEKERFREELPQQVLGAANQIELTLNYR